MLIFKFAELWNSERWSAVSKQFFLLRHLSLWESSPDSSNPFKLVIQVCICMHHTLSWENFLSTCILSIKSSTFNKQWIWIKPTLFFWWTWGEFSGYVGITSLIHNFQNQWRCKTYTSKGLVCITTCRFSTSSEELSVCVCNMWMVSKATWSKPWLWTIHQSRECSLYNQI